MTNTSTISNANYYTTSNNHVSLMDRFKKYMKENGPMIAAGMLAMTGDTNAWRMYVESQR